MLYVTHKLYCLVNFLTRETLISCFSVGPVDGVVSGRTGAGLLKITRKIYVAQSLFKLLQAYQQSSNSSTRIYLAKWQVPIEVHPFVPFIVHRPVCMNRKGCANSPSCALHTIYKSSNRLQIQSLCKRLFGNVTVSKIQYLNNSPAIRSCQKYFLQKIPLTKTI